MINMAEYHIFNNRGTSGFSFFLKKKKNYCESIQVLGKKKRTSCKNYASRLYLRLAMFRAKD